MAEQIRFQEIYEAHATAIYRCLLAWSRNAATAEDLTAETFVRALAAEQSVQASTARAYLVVIARNLWREQVRRGWRQEPMEAAPPPVTGPDAIGRIELQTILDAIAELPEPLREPLVLFAQGGLSYDEIASQLQLPLATVKIRIFRARQKLEKFR
jgi:RNA polymerase sigma-70 factor, ECF subfamily